MPFGERLDEQIAAVSPRLDLPADVPFSPVEPHLGRHRHPLAVAGVVENSLIRLLDPAVTLPEHSRVIIVTTEGRQRSRFSFRLI